MRDIDIRDKLKDTYLKKYFNDSNSKVVDELSVSYGTARVDIAVINGSFHGYEIKSDYDTLNRLPNQIQTYSKTFDYLTVITGEHHLEGVVNNIPDWCGIILASHTKKKDGVKLRHIRQPQRNKLIENLSIVQLLWKDELIMILEDAGIKKGLNNKSKPFLWSCVLEKIAPEKISSTVRERLKLRANWRVE